MHWFLWGYTVGLFLIHTSGPAENSRFDASSSKSQHWAGKTTAVFFLPTHFHWERAKYDSNPDIILKYLFKTSQNNPLVPKWKLVQLDKSSRQRFYLFPLCNLKLLKKDDRFFFFVFFFTGMTLFLRADHWDSSLETLKAGQSKPSPRGKESGIKNSGLACTFGGESGAKRENRELFFFFFLLKSDSQICAARG